ncbi:MmgE/PrpD family protein [Rubrivivax sp. RP6-9]|uniref:MmgE/PrpD family protein n=1 Tax=Rubrivivax sp. RP6-9 TaxID=3415750 RepID=UPI003CC52B0F
MARNTPVAADTGAPPITRTLAQFVATHPSRGWDDDVEQAAVRTLLNWLGCTLGAAQHEAPRAALAACQVLQPAPQAAVLGRRERVDIASAALVNGIASHTFDFDDTHLKTIIHPAGPVAPALLALAELQGSSGRAVLDALVLGIDVACRMGNVVYPDHYDRGWHITGTAGVLGAAAGCARLLCLDAARTTMALGIAASQPVGLREQFGSMSKPLHPGAAARTGLMAALMAQQGFTASPRALEAPRGWAQVLSTRFDWHEATTGLGQQFEIALNTFKPFACGVVVHPAIDACTQLRAQGVTAGQVERIELQVHPLVLELCGRQEPADGLQAKFSVHHGCAAGLVFGRAGEAEFADAVVTRPDIVALRRKVVATVRDGIAEEAVDLVATLTDGRRVHVVVEHAIGSLARPMDDAALAAKFHAQADPVLGAVRSGEILAACRDLARAPDVRRLAALCQP